MLKVREKVDGLVSKKWNQFLVLNPDILSHLSHSRIEHTGVSDKQNVNSE